VQRTVELPNGMKLDFVRIPAGRFIMGDRRGQPDQPERKVEITEAFWMSTIEITNAVFRSVFPEHNSRHIDQQWKDHIYPGYEANGDKQPAIRMTWERAVEFCQLLSEQTGLKMQLPAEEQWEWAARAGSRTEMYYGAAKKDFSEYENLADYTMRDLAVIGVDPKPMGPKNNRFRFYNFVPKVEKYNDGVLVPRGTGMYKPNAWGLCDMLGNVAEWTSSDYLSGDQLHGDETVALKVARGGSWRDRPEYATAATRDGYYPFQKVFNVGLRVVISDPFQNLADR